MKTIVHFELQLSTFFSELEMFQTKVVEKIKTHNNVFSDNSAVYEIMWKNIVGRGRTQMAIWRGRTQMAIWRMRIACWIPKAAYTHSEYVTFIVFPLQEWLHERTSVLSYAHIGCLVIIGTECVYRAVHSESLNMVQYRKGGDCRVGLVIPDTPFRRYWCCRLAKSRWTKFFYHRNLVVTCRHTVKVRCFQVYSSISIFSRNKSFRR
jgi:hypothetical protein